MSYFVIQHTADETQVYVSDIPAAIKKVYQLAKAVPRLPDWPNNIEFQFSDTQPEGLALTDLIENPKGWLICSRRLAELFANSPGAEVELLPVSILNHKGRMATRDYFIVNVLRMIPAVDRAASVFMPSSAEPDVVFSFTSLALDASALTDSPAVFRLKEQYKTILVRGDLADAIRSAAMTGIRLVEPAAFKQ